MSLSSKLQIGQVYLGRGGFRVRNESLEVLPDMGRHWNRGRGRLGFSQAGFLRIDLGFVVSASQTAVTSTCARVMKLGKGGLRKVPSRLHFSLNSIKTNMGYTS